MKLAPVALALAAVATLSGCQTQDDIYVTDAWVRLAAVEGRPAAAYFTLHGYSKDSTLIDVANPVSLRTEIHETMTHDNMSTMAAITAVPLPAKSTVAFTPGGKHVMLFDVNPSVKPGSTIPLTLTFTGFPRIEVDAVVVAAGDPAPFKDK
ncbi:copper chaperone PCu(A)C [Hephaestia sp. GCM10023244]|uniref:copper chaperone PCu(A)C n=1 Tax=unclassified Hephaestia TaxID=2631281 RepID=UPI00207754AD|nr:copper chaperone PCu(A)C [Hephaestia sp. MAHUQ-44]MCM8729603.1 copper chaperone PCu(A)C [Hephaestia sp. MAHUQ-44]